MAPLQLPFCLEPQQGRFLCWAAVAVSLKRYYAPAADIDQLTLARQIHGGSPDHVCPPLVALQAVGLSYREQSQPLPVADIRQQLQRGHPVLACLRFFVGWHWVVISGMDGDVLTIQDSAHGTSQWPHDVFTHAYRGAYHWTHSYQWISCG